MERNSEHEELSEREQVIVAAASNIAVVRASCSKRCADECLDASTPSHHVRLTLQHLFANTNGALLSNVQQHTHHTGTIPIPIKIRMRANLKKKKKKKSILTILQDKADHAAADHDNAGLEDNENGIRPNLVFGLLPECKRCILSFLTLQEALKYKSTCRHLHNSNDVFQYSHLFQYNDYEQHQQRYSEFFSSLECFKDYVKAQNRALTGECSLGRGSLRSLIRNDCTSFDLLVEIVEDDKKAAAAVPPPA